MSNRLAGAGPSPLSDESPARIDEVLPSAATGNTRHMATRALSHDTLESVLEPLDRICAIDLVLFSDLALAPPSLRNACSWSRPAIVISQTLRLTTVLHNLHAAVEVHSIDTDCRVVLDA